MTNCRAGRSHRWTLFFNAEVQGFTWGLKTVILRDMSNHTKNDVDRYCAMLKALSNPQRLRIFLKLAEECDSTSCVATHEGMRRCVGDLGEDLGVAPSTVSHHLKELRQAGLMSVERRGQRIECWIDIDALEQLDEFFRSVLGIRKPEPTARRSATARRR